MAYLGATNANLSGYRPLGAQQQAAGQRIIATMSRSSNAANLLHDMQSMGVIHELPWYGTVTALLASKSTLTDDDKRMITAKINGWGVR